MRNEAFIPASADYSGMGLHVDVLERKPSRPVSPVVAIKPSSGRAVVADRVPEADAETWAAGLRHQANDHRYYELTHDALGHQFEHYYLLLKDHAGKTRAIQPFLLVNQDLVTGMPKAIRHVMDRV